jgi:anti-sigma regulatory factor (Ser/Thr protein kinase)
VVELRRWRLIGGDVAGAMEARRAFRQFVRAVAAPPSDVPGAELIFGELAANSAEHGAGVMTIALCRDGIDLVLSVRDAGAWLPGVAAADRPEPSQLRGRGLFFVRWIARSVEKSASGTAARIVLPVTLR